MKHSYIKYGAMIFIFMLIGCIQERHTYSAEPVYARVIDGNTGKPIEGVVVVGYWEIHQGSIAGEALPCGAANVEEAVTDKNGQFRIPGWGPVTGTCGIMRNGNPFVFFFKPGYVYLRKAGGIGFDFTKPVSVAQVDWNGQNIKLYQYPNLNLRDDGLGSYANDFTILNHELGMFIVNMPSQCNWRKIPSTLRAVLAQSQSFQAVGNYDFYSIALTLMQDDQDKLMQHIAPHCGSPKVYIESLEK